MSASSFDLPTQDCARRFAEIMIICPNTPANTKLISKVLYTYTCAKVLVISGIQPAGRPCRERAMKGHFQFRQRVIFCDIFGVTSLFFDTYDEIDGMSLCSLLKSRRRKEERKEAQIDLVVADSHKDSVETVG